jgi:hypothetical protein
VLPEEWKNAQKIGVRPLFPAKENERTGFREFANECHLG